MKRFSYTSFIAIVVGFLQLGSVVAADTAYRQPLLRTRAASQPTVISQPTIFSSQPVLYQAVTKGDLAGVEKEIDEDSKIMKNTRWVEEIAEEAAKVGSVAILKHLKERGADFNGMDVQKRILLPAIRKGRTNVIRHLVMDNIMRRSGAPFALIQAARFGRLGMVKFLLERRELGLSVNESDPEGKTPLHHAVTAREGMPLIRFLVLRGANLDEQDAKGETPLHKLARLGRYGQRVRLLREHGARTDVRNDEGKTPVVIAPAGAIKEAMKIKVDIAKKREAEAARRREAEARIAAGR